MTTSTPRVPITGRSIMPPRYQRNPEACIGLIDWNRADDPKDREVWNRLAFNFWFPEKVPLSNNLPSWHAMAQEERIFTMRVFTGLTMLDTVQATVGEISQTQDARTEHKEAVYTNIAFMQAVHARSYSSIFSTLCPSEEIDATYEWVVDNDLLQRRAKIALHHYYGDDPLKRKVSAALLSSLSLYAGFHLLLYFSVWAKLMSIADMTRLILRDKAVHGYYSGYKYQCGLEMRSEEKHKQMRDSIYTLLEELYELEMQYSGAPYEPLGLMDDAAVFACYSANKALMNLGYSARFAPKEAEVKAEILAALAPGADENHGFSSGSGSSYVIGTAEETSDEDREL